MFREEWVPQGQIPQAAASDIYELEGRIAQYDLPKGCLVSTPFASGLYAYANPRMKGLSEGLFIDRDFQKVMNIDGTPTKGWEDFLYRPFKRGVD